MASSRWKRFAFFERQTLTVPPDILEDLIPQHHETKTKATAVARTSSSSSSIVSLTVSTAALPLYTKPSRMVLLRTGGDPQQPPSSPSAAAEEENSSAVNLMWSSLTACTSPDLMLVSASNNQQQQQQQQQQTSLSAAAASSVRLPSQSQAALVPSTSSSYSSSSTTTVLDGLVLAMVSSKESALVHCFDLTVRCNPPTSITTSTGNNPQQQPPTSSTTSGVEGATTAGATSATSSTTSNKKKNNNTAATMEDMDGWRGYWNPFAGFAAAAAAAATSSSTSTTTIVDTAACRIPSAVVVGAPRQAQHSALHVACLGPSTDRQHQIVVWEDPHLHLSCCRPLMTATTSSSSRDNSSNSNEDWVVFSTNSSTTTSVAPSSQQQQQQPPSVVSSTPQQPWNAMNDGNAVVIDIVPGLVAVGTDAGVVLLYAYNHSSSSSSPHKTKGTSRTLRPYVRIPSPPVVPGGVQVVSVQLGWAAHTSKVVHVFVAYNRDPGTAQQQQQLPSSLSGTTTATASLMNTAGICCYDVPWPPPTTASQQLTLSAPSARHDLDGRYVGSSSLVDSATITTTTSSHNNKNEPVLRVTVARPDGLYSYSQTERIGVAPIDGTKLAMCLIPPPVPAEKARQVDLDQVGYVLVASTDDKSGRDAVDIYDATNKLVAFHLLLSPGHRAVQASGVTTLPTLYPDGSVRGGRSSAVVFTSGGALVTFTEKLTQEKIALLTQKNLYSAAIVVAYADPSYDASVITNLYQQYAEYLYRKGDFSGAIEQYMHTIGSLESSHVIFRYLDAPKIPLLVKYLEKLRSRELATPVHNELLRTCYLKLNDVSAAESIAVAATTSSAAAVHDASLESIVSNLAHKPKDALATICSLEAPRAAEFLVVYGASLARALPRETAGVVITLCVGTYTPKALADCSGSSSSSIADTLGAAAAITTTAAATSLELNQMVNSNSNPAVVMRPYPIHLFASAFVEHPKILRLLLAHCNRNKCPLTPSLRRTLLELTLAEWNHAKLTGDTEAEKLRHKEAIASLTDSHCREIGDYDALVIVQLAGFEEGELLLYERLQMTPMLLERYAKDGSEKSRRQMLAICQTDPEVLADVLGHFVELASERLQTHRTAKEKQDAPNNNDDDSEDDEAAEIMEDIQEALALARRQNVLPPVRIARILAGEGTGPFRAERSSNNKNKPTVPLSVALDYVGTILEESRRETSRLKSEIEEYNELCNSMENEIDALLRASYVLPPSVDGENATNRFFNIDELYTKVKTDEADGGSSSVSGVMMSEQAREAFWREMEQSEDSFDVISRFFAKGVIR